MTDNVGGIKIESGKKREFNTGAKKQPASGKGTPVLFPSDAYLEISKHFEDGAAVYSPRNWEKGIPLSKLIDSLERHIAQEKMGLTDERHDRALAWNAVVYLATKMRIQAGILPKELADLCGIYGEQEIISFEFEINNVSGGGNDRWYIYEKVTGQYLRKDLKLYLSCGRTEFHPSKRAAKKHLQKYLNKNRTNIANEPYKGHGGEGGG